MTPWIIQNILLNVINKISSMTCINFQYEIFSCKHIVWMELDKSQLLYQLHDDYISLAHTKDLEQRTVIWRHDNMSDVILRKIAFNLHVFLELSLIWQYLSMRFECYGTHDGETECSVTSTHHYTTLYSCNISAPVGLPLQVGFHGDLLQWLNWLKQSERFYRVRLCKVFVWNAGQKY